MSLFASLSFRRRRTSDQASLPPPSYRSQPPSYYSRSTGQDQATSAPDELSIRTESIIEVPTQRQRRPKVFLYYKVFRLEGAIPCKEPVNPRDPYLARIETVHITPPQTVASMIRCVVKKENIQFDPSYLKPKLFEDSSSLVPIKQQKRLAVMNGSGPGSDPRKPLALVLVDAFDKKIRAIFSSDNSDNSANGSGPWLSFHAGQALYTNGILLKELPCWCTFHGRYNNHKHDAYQARDSSGRVGYIRSGFFI